MVYGGGPGETDINLHCPFLRSGDRGKAKAGPTEDQTDIMDKASPLPLMTVNVPKHQSMSPRERTRALSTRNMLFISLALRCISHITSCAVSTPYYFWEPF